MTGPAAQYGQEQEFQGEGFKVIAFASPHNARLRVVAYEGENFAGMKFALVGHALRNGLGKIFIKARRRDRPAMELAGFTREATILGYYNGEDADVMSLFPDERRARPSAPPLPAMPGPAPSQACLPAGLECRRAIPADITAMTSLFKETFLTYPFPVHDPEFLRASMAAGNIYRLLLDGPTIAAMAAAEIDFSHHNAELTDFATRGEYRGQGLACSLRQTLEQDLAEARIPNQYTLARACSVGMNRVFARGGYRHTGTLLRNCTIAGDFEDMTCWTRKLDMPRQ